VILFMKKLNFYQLRRLVLAGLSASLFTALLCSPASAQTAVATPPQQTPATVPLNLDSDDVAKEMSKEQHPTDTKPDVLSATQNNFEQSILNSESRKKVTGMVEAGAGVGSIPAQRGFKGENFNCENAAVAINDEISRNTQVGVYAQTYSCNAR